MNIEKLLLSVILSDNNLSDEQCEEFIIEVKSAIKNNCLLFLKKLDIPIGFFTYFKKGSKTLINNLFILPQYREKNNLVSIRKYLRSIINSSEYHWENYKHNRVVTVK